MLYYSDFQCPFCAKFEAEALPEIQDNHISSAEEVRLIVKPLGVFGDDSLRAAQAAHSVWRQVDGDQDIFWSWYETVTDAYDGEQNSGWASVDNLVSLSDSFNGVSGDSIRTHLENSKYESAVAADFEEGREQGLQGTPYFIVYGDDFDESRTISGAQPYSRFETVIDSYLE